MDSEYIILHEGLFIPERIKYELIGEIRKYPENINTHTEKRWKELKRINPDYFDGRVYSFINHRINNGALELKIQETDYKYYLTTNCDSYPPDMKTAWANILALCCVVETSDHKIIVGKRNVNLAENINMWHVPGGNLDAISGQDTFSTMMLKEIKEEINIQPDDIDYMVCIGLGLCIANNKPELLFYASSLLDEFSIRRKLSFASDSNEHTDIQFIKKEKIHDFVNDNSFAPIGKAAIHQYEYYYKSLCERSVSGNSTL